MNLNAGVQLHQLLCGLGQEAELAVGFCGTDLAIAVQVLWTQGTVDAIGNILTTFGSLDLYCVAKDTCLLVLTGHKLVKLFHFCS